MTLPRSRRGAVLLVLLGGCSGADRGADGPRTIEPPPDPAPDLPAEILAPLQALSPKTLPGPRPDVTNAFADDPDAAAFGHKLFFDKRFSGPLLAEDNTGVPGTLGLQGETSRVACSDCHVPASGFLDTRSSRRQLSLASGWTRRRTPSLLDFAQRSLLMWDGRRDTAYNQLFGVIENPLEFNSSRLFVAQQILRYYQTEYEALFGPLPSLDAYPVLDPKDAGCAEMPADEVNDRCLKMGHEDPAVMRIVANAGKAIGAYERRLSCGPSRFDAWMHGDETALTEQEQAGAILFVEVGCDKCHSGPNFTDEKFYNVGAGNITPNFIEPYDDPGASAGLAAMLADPLNSRGVFSDGDDGRLDAVPVDRSKLVGAFRTPSLRCVGKRPSFMHAGQIRSLEDVVVLFNQGGDRRGFQGEKDPSIVPLGLTSDERAQLVSFLRALDGPGPDPSLLAAPALPE